MNLNIYDTDRESQHLKQQLLIRLGFLNKFRKPLIIGNITFNITTLTVY